MRSIYDSHKFSFIARTDCQFNVLSKRHRCRRRRTLHTTTWSLLYHTHTNTQYYMCIHAYFGGGISSTIQILKYFIEERIHATHLQHHDTNWQFKDEIWKMNSMDETQYTSFLLLTTMIFFFNSVHYIYVTTAPLAFIQFSRAFCIPI